MPLKTLIFRFFVVGSALFALVIATGQLVNASDEGTPKLTPEQRKAERARIAAEQQALVATFVWSKMGAAEITAVLTDRQLEYPNWTGGGLEGNPRYLRTQSFHKNGDTSYVDGRPSTGQWQVRGDQYCSVWPPSDAWSCYDMWQVDAHADWVRFRGNDGVNWDGLLK